MSHAQPTQNRNIFPRGGDWLILLFVTFKRRNFLYNTYCSTCTSLYPTESNLPDLYSTRRGFDLKNQKKSQIFASSGTLHTLPYILTQKIELSKFTAR